MATRIRSSSQPDLLLFGLRWLIPLAVVVDGALRTAPGEPVALSDPAWGLIIGTSVYNLGLLLALNSNLPRQTLAAFAVVTPTVLLIQVVRRRMSRGGSRGTGDDDDHDISTKDPTGGEIQ